MIAREGARVVSATGEGNGGSPADAFLRTVIDGAAQYERGLIRARTLAALAVKRARGERVGAVPTASLWNPYVTLPLFPAATTDTSTRWGG